MTTKTPLLAVCVICCSLTLSGCDFLKSLFGGSSTPAPVTFPYPGPGTATICTLYTYSYTSPIPGTASAGTMPGWLALTTSGSTLTLAGTPQGNDWGVWPFSVTGTATGGASATVNGTITVSPTPTIATNPRFRWRGAGLSNPVTITVTPPCAYKITAVAENVQPTAQIYTPNWATITTPATGVTTLRVSPASIAPNDDGDVLLTITSNAPGAATVTAKIKMEHIQ